MIAVGKNWSLAAQNCLRVYAEDHQEFTTWDAREAIEQTIGVPRNPLTYGSVFGVGIKRGHIERIGYVSEASAYSARCHGRPTTLYRSLLYKNGKK